MKIKDDLIRRKEVILIIQNIIRNIQMQDYGSDSGIRYLYDAIDQIIKLPDDTPRLGKWVKAE